MDIEDIERRNLFIDPENIKMENCIGRGSQGYVYNAYNKKNNQKYAIKVLNTNYMSQKQQQRLKMQIQSNFTLSSKSRIIYFPYFYGYWITSTQAYLIFEKCDGNALQGINLNRTPSCSYSFAYVLLYDILNALEMLESRNIIHRDLKPENILMHKGQFKICDLGLSRIAHKGKKFTIQVGNIMSKSPEFYTGQYDCKTDVWSLGINVFWLAFGNLPFNEEIKNLIKEKKISELILKISKKQFNVNLGKNQLYLIQILSKMLQIQKQKRLTATQILQIFFKQCNFNKNDVFEQIKYLFFKFLSYRQENIQIAVLYLIMMFLVADFTKLENYLRSFDDLNQIDHQNSKKQIIKRIKLNIFYMLQFISKQEKDNNNQEINSLFQYYLGIWYIQLKNDNISQNKLQKSIKNIEQALQLHKIKGIAQKFCLMNEAANLYKFLGLQQRNDNLANIWNIKSLDLRKLKI